MADADEYKRGQIRYRERARQIVDFSGLRYDLITPTDIDGVIAPITVDGLIEFQRRCYVFVEFKHVGNPVMPGGQKWAFERIADDLRKPAVVLLAVHDTTPDEDIDAAAARERAVYWRGKWTDMDDKYDVHTLATKFLRKYGGLPA